jgi:hypothetical protein
MVKEGLFRRVDALVGENLTLTDIGIIVDQRCQAVASILVGAHAIRED